MASSPIEVLPVVHARDGALVGPDGKPMRHDLREVARRFAKDHGALYFVDLDGLARNRPDLGLVQELAARVPVWADCGSRFHSDVMDLFIAGAEQVTVRHQTARDRSTLDEAMRLTEHVALGIEFSGRRLAENPRWPASAAELVTLARAHALPLVVVDLDRAGRQGGVDKGVAWHARAYGPGAYYAGGVATERDLAALADLGFRGALVATALLGGAHLSGSKWPGAMAPAGQGAAGVPAEGEQ